MTRDEFVANVERVARESDTVALLRHKIAGLRAASEPDIIFRARAYTKGATRPSGTIMPGDRIDIRVLDPDGDLVLIEDFTL